MFQTKPTKPNLLNQIYQAQLNKPNLQNQIYQTKPTKQNLTPRRTLPDFTGTPFSMHILYGLDL